MTLLSANRAMIIPLNSNTNGTRRSSKLFTASFIGGSADEEHEEAGDGSDNASACDWNFILESMHIAFMQQEALRF